MNAISWIFIFLAWTSLISSSSSESDSDSGEDIKTVRVAAPVASQNGVIDPKHYPTNRDLLQNNTKLLNERVEHAKISQNEFPQRNYSHLNGASIPAKKKMRN